MQLNVGYAGRAAAILDSTRLNSTVAQGSLLPASIPVQGQPFFGRREQATVQGTGSVFNLNGNKASTAGGYGTASDPNVNVFASLIIPSFADGGGSILQQAYAQYNQWVAGLGETALADNTSLPETLDFAGPNARITALQAGQGKGQGRLSRYIFSDGQRTGFRGNLSIEQPTPEIRTVTGTGTIASIPDFIATLRYSNGMRLALDPKQPDKITFIENWHIQYGSVFRSLGLQNANNSAEYAFGWGSFLSGVYRIPARECLTARDGVFGSITYGEGISHYIMDLQTPGMMLATSGNDAVVNPTNVLVPLPALAWFTGYTHNWTDRWRSTASFSQANLYSPGSLGANASPFQYRQGNYVAVNLLRHSTVQDTTTQKKSHALYYGVEFLWGQKQTLNGAEGHDERLMFVMAVSNPTD